MSSEFCHTDELTLSIRIPIWVMLVIAAFALLIVGCANVKERSVLSPKPTLGTSDDQKFSTGKVVRVIDGVTIEVKMGDEIVTVRYLGLSVPDKEAFGPDGASIYDKALQFNRFLVEDHGVEMERDGVNVDSMGHLLRYVYVDGEMVNKVVLTNGYAKLSDSPRDYKHKMVFAIAQEGAKEGRRGYWEPPPSDNGDITPSPSFGGGTLPRAPGASCDFSGTSKPIIKGNIVLE